MRKSSKSPRVGTGGHNRRRLEGRGPTPRAEQRTGHPAAAKRRAAEAASSKRTRGGRDGDWARRPEYVAGRHAVVEALQAGVPATAVYRQTGLDPDDRVRDALTLANDAGLSIVEATRTDLERLTGGAVHQGLVLQVPPYDYPHPLDLLDRARQGRPPLVAALDRVTDPRNLGAVVRSVGAFGGLGVVVPARRAVGVTASAWKASAGAIVRTPVAAASNLTRALRDYQEAGLLVVGLDAHGDVEVGDLVPRYDADRRGVCLVVGAEGAGLGRLVQQTCDVVVGIPMASGTESLNASVAAGIALYHLRRA